jgi:signal transduction histidine kinase
MALVTIQAPTPARTGLAPVLNGIGAVVVAFWLIRGGTVPGGLTPTVLIVSFVAIVAWAVRAIVWPNPSTIPATARRAVLLDVLLVVMVLTGSLMTVPTDGLLVTPAIVAVAAATGSLHRPIAFGVILGLVGFAIVAAALLLDHLEGTSFLGYGGGFALGLVVGFSRRQGRAAEVRERELAARDLEVEREQQRSAILADRATVARDIHDVLAHSLGGLVIQLDAVEALLESGRVDDAATRVSSARALAAEGLGEARRAVAALRDPRHDQTARSDSLGDPDALDRLIGAHESLGGRVVVSGAEHGAVGEALAGLDARHRRVLAAVAREALSNARRHAPGETVSLSVGRDAATTGILRVRLSNAVPADAPVSPGGGHGLRGMRERVDELADRSAMTAERTGDRFAVEVALEVAAR